MVDLRNLAFTNHCMMPERSPGAGGHSGSDLGIELE